MILTADQRSSIQRAIDTERRRIVQPANATRSCTGRSLADWCIDQADGDALIAVDLAVTAHATVRRLKSTGRGQARTGTLA